MKNKQASFTLAEGAAHTLQKGFTLAEVLITLGIIGVVAAMTIPTLIANTNSAKFSSQFKKSLSQLNQAALMAQAQWDTNYGTLDGKDKSNTTQCLKNHSLADGDNTICALFNFTLAGATYLSATDLSNLTFNGKKYKIARNYNLEGDHYATSSGSIYINRYIGYQLADGSLVVIRNALRDCTLDGPWDGTFPNAQGKFSSLCLGYIDVNGPALPNKEVVCKTPSDTNFSTEPCTVPKDPSHLTDIYPVIFHNQTVEPATNAAKAVLTGATAKKSE